MRDPDNYMERGADYHNRLNQLSTAVSTIIVRIHICGFISTVTVCGNHYSRLLGIIKTCGNKS